MDSEDDYENRMDTRVSMEHEYAIGCNDDEIERANSFLFENGSDLDDPLVFSPPHTMDIPSVCRPPLPVMVPADRVSTLDLPLAETLAVVEKELFHNGTRSVGLNTCVEEREKRKRVHTKKRDELTHRKFELKLLKLNVKYWS